MPKSKRDKKVSLTKTDKKGLALKQRIVEDVRGCAEKFNSVYVFSYENLRTEKMHDIRQHWKPSRFFFGKNRVVALALGKSPEDEACDDLHKLSKYLKGQCGLLFTDTPKDEVVEWFNGFAEENYARSGFTTPSTIKLEKGPLQQFAHSQEPYLRKLGLPTQLERGVVTLIKNYKVCKTGQVLTPEQAKLLELLDIKLASFRFVLKASWIKGQGVEKFSKAGQDDVEMKDEEEDDEEN